MNTIKLLILVATVAVLLSMALFGAPSRRVADAAGGSFGTNTPSDRAARVQVTSNGHALGFGERDWVLSNGSYALRVEFVGSHSVSPIRKATHTATQQPAPLTRVEYPNLWDGITLTYRAPTSGVVESVYRIQPNADPSAIRLGDNAPVTVNADGALSIQFATGTLSESAPVAWQEIDGHRVPVEVAFAVDGDREVGFALGARDPYAAVMIDPTMNWLTFLGGKDVNAGNAGFGIGVDGNGNVYVGGESQGTWGNPIRPFGGSVSDAFLAKLDSNGMLLWNTFLGGGGNEWGATIAVDGSGTVYVTGDSNATWGAGECTGCPIRAFSSDADAFAAKLDANGSLKWNTFLGGTGLDIGRGIGVDGTGNVYVAGSSNATWGAGECTGCPIRAYSADRDTYVAKLDSGGALTWNTFLGGSGSDSANDGGILAVDTSGNSYVTGTSSATWGTPIRAYASNGDDFAAKFDSSGTLVWNTFLGGSDFEDAGGIAVGASGNAYVSGTSYATWGTPVRPYAADGDGFAARLDSSGALVWNTFLGGSGADGAVGIASDLGHAIAVDQNQNAYVAGESYALWGTPIRLIGTAFAVRIPAAPGCGEKPQKPKLLNPAQKAKPKGPKIKFNWTDADCATTYKILVKEGSKTGDVAFKDTGLTQSQAATTKLSSGETYLWRVFAINDFGKSQSVWYRFTVK